MRPSGRNASRHGSLKVVTVVIVKGRLASGFCSPTLACAQVATAPMVKSTAVSVNFIVISPRFSSDRSPEAGRFLRGRSHFRTGCCGEIALPRTTFIALLLTVLYTDTTGHRVQVRLFLGLVDGRLGSVADFPLPMRVCARRTLPKSRFSLLKFRQPVFALQPK